MNCAYCGDYFKPKALRWAKRQKFCSTEHRMKQANLNWLKKDKKRLKGGNSK